MRSSLTAGIGITDSTQFVIFDMEWNQPFPGKQYSFDASNLKGEIIDIGAVKYRYENGGVSRISEFSATIRPRCYKKLHYHVKKVTHKCNEDLKTGVSFEEAINQFLDFCDSSCILVGWGTSDPDMLKTNLKFFGLDSELRRAFLDLQPIFSRFAGEKGKQRSVEYAVDYFKIPKDDTFHSALADAHYTALVFGELFEHNKTSELLSVITSSLVDPDIQLEFNYRGVEMPSVNEAIASASGFCAICPICSSNLKFSIPAFRIRKSVYSLSECVEHGDFFSRTRIKKLKDKAYFATAVLRYATQPDYYLIAEKAEEFAKYGSKGALIIPSTNYNVDLKPSSGEFTKENQQA